MSLLDPRMFDELQRDFYKHRCAILFETVVQNSIGEDVAGDPAILTGHESIRCYPAQQSVDDRSGKRLPDAAEINTNIYQVGLDRLYPEILTDMLADISDPSGELPTVRYNIVGVIHQGNIDCTKLIVEAIS